MVDRRYTLGLFFDSKKVTFSPVEQKQDIYKYIGATDLYISMIVLKQ